MTSGTHRSGITSPPSTNRFEARHEARSGWRAGRFGWAARAAMAVIVAVAVALLVAGCGSLPAGHAAKVATRSPSATPSAAPSPDAKAKLQGACAYSLGSDPVDGTAVATGDIQVTNNGNIGARIRLRITWPQQGFAPLAKVKTVKLGAGQSADVQFHHPMTSDQVDGLQNWQMGHDDADGCGYHGVIVSTFGSAR